jgi:selenide,water dikinase
MNSTNTGGSSVPALASDQPHLVLAGGGHTHALLLKQWLMRPQSRPKALITLVSSSSNALYSGLIPTHLSGQRPLEAISINVRSLADKAGVHFIKEEVKSVDLTNKSLQLNNRPAISFDLLSLNLGAIVPKQQFKAATPIKPLDAALQAFHRQDQTPKRDRTTFHVVGAGLAAIEVVFALRRRWPYRPLVLHCSHHQLDNRLANALRAVNITLTDASAPDNDNTVLCTGSKAPDWLQVIGLRCDMHGRVLTKSTLQCLDYPWLFASGDCASIQNQPRPASGVYAVKAAPILATNLKRQLEDRPLKSWKPQQRALQLVGTHTPNQQNTAWAKVGTTLLGPNPWLWRWKQHLDNRFIQSFQRITTTSGTMNHQGDAANTMACRGCAAKLGASPLKQALQWAGVASLGSDPADAQAIGSNSENATLLTSVDGFPALLSDPWLNGRLTTLHACSDLWSSGAEVSGALAVLTLPATDEASQIQLMSQTLAGIRSALDEQNAVLLGGHTMESRQTTSQPVGLDLQVSLSVIGSTAPNQPTWGKGPILSGDQLLLSRPLGTGVLFAAAMQGRCPGPRLDQVLEELSQSQHHRLMQLRAADLQEPGSIHACTDVTGFGLLGHLNEMVDASEAIQVKLAMNKIPAFKGVSDLLALGITSTAAPANRQAWSSLEHTVTFTNGDLTSVTSSNLTSLELLIDPQTCGPLLVSCTPTAARILISQGWKAIGAAMQ